MLMMMRVSVTSVLLILGIFCSASWAQPGNESAVVVCLRESGTAEECFGPLAAAFPGPPPQMWNQIETTDLSETCAPLITARNCVTRQLAECGAFGSTGSEVVEVIRHLTVANMVLDYVCRDNVEVFDEFRVCLHEHGGILALGWAVDHLCIGTSRPPPRHVSFCIPRDIAACATGLVEDACGEEIGRHLRAVDEMILEEFGCEGTRKRFKMMKKDIQSPLELINEALSSLF